MLGTLRLAVVGGLVALLMLVPGVALAGTQGSCSSGDATKVRLWENEESDTSDGNDSVWVCVAEDWLRDISHTLSGDCNRPWPPSGTWNDCVSSYTIWVPDGKRFCLYRDVDNGTVIQNKLGPLNGVRIDLSPTWSDTPSSLRWRESWQGC